MTLQCEVLFCDDIRQEVTGKHILVGVYPADLVLTALPGTIPLAAWIRVRGLSPGRHAFQLELRPPGGKPFRVNGDGSNGDEPVTLVIAGMLIEIGATGDLEAWLSFDGDEPFRAGTLPIRQRRADA